MDTSNSCNLYNNTNPMLVLKCKRLLRGLLFSMLAGFCSIFLLGESWTCFFCVPSRSVRCVHRKCTLFTIKVHWMSPRLALSSGEGKRGALYGLRWSADTLAISALGVSRVFRVRTVANSATSYFTKLCEKLSKTGRLTCACSHPSTALLRKSDDIALWRKKLHWSQL